MTNLDTLLSVLALIAAGSMVSAGLHLRAERRHARLLRRIVRR